MLRAICGSAEGAEGAAYLEIPAEDSNFTSETGAGCSTGAVVDGLANSEPGNPADNSASVNVRVPGCVATDSVGAKVECEECSAADVLDGTGALGADAARSLKMERDSPGRMMG